MLRTVQHKKWKLDKGEHSITLNDVIDKKIIYVNDEDDESQNIIICVK